VIRHAVGGVALTLVILATACGDNGAGQTLPSGAFDAVAPEAAREAVLGLCDLAVMSDAREARAMFLDRSHATLHVIAAAAVAEDRASATALLEAKQRVEAALARNTLPPRFRRDVETLIDATRRARRAPRRGAPTRPR
jgi:hypothetical protein